MLNILRRPEIERRFGKPRSTMYAEQAAGLFPPPIALGARSVGWIESEVITVVSARAAGLSDDQLRSLVAQLLANRAQGNGGITVEAGAALIRDLTESTPLSGADGADADQRRTWTKSEANPISMVRRIRAKQVQKAGASC